MEISTSASSRPSRTAPEGRRPPADLDFDPEARIDMSVVTGPPAARGDDPGLCVPETADYAVFAEDDFHRGDPAGGLRPFFD